MAQYKIIRITVGNENSSQKCANKEVPDKEAVDVINC